MTDKFANYVETVSGPASNAFPITASSSTPFTYATRAIWVGTSGDVEVCMLNGSSNVIFKAVPAGTLLPIRTTYCSTASSASNLLGLY
jgi:hypothetical protein